MPVAVLLGIAIAAEIIGTTALRAAHGFTRLIPTLVVAAMYPLSFFLLSKVLQRMSIGVTYAVWSGVGTAAIAVIGAVAFHESLSPLKIGFLILVIVGVVGLQLSGPSS
ncbi:MAG: DMT family transporter [Frankia sp.]